MKKAEWVVLGGAILVFLVLIFLVGCEDDIVQVQLPDPVVVEKEVPVDRPVPQHVKLDVVYICAVDGITTVQTGEPVVIHRTDTICVPPAPILPPEIIIRDSIIYRTKFVTDTVICVRDGGRLVCP